MKNIFSVAQVNKYVKKFLEHDALLAGLFVEGEISNCSAFSSGHLYFTMKDADAAISAVMFRGNAANLNFIPKNGMKVIAFGKISLYEKTGQYQIFVDFLEPAGIGGLQLAFSQLKEKLEAEGLFSPERKREITRYAKCVAIITSPTGAAFQDILKIIRERNRAVKIILAPASVQGENAVNDMVRAIREVNAHAEADTIILGRGGGSIEDLQAFNEEILARAIVASKIPIISAVGHETDFTISDFAADLRAPTPTAAAQIAVYDQKFELEKLHELHNELFRALQKNLHSHSEKIQKNLAQLSRAINEKIFREKKNLSHIEQLLEKVSPFAIFKRGFALVHGEIKVGQNIEITFESGRAVAEVKKIF